MKHTTLFLTVFIFILASLGLFAQTDNEKDSTKEKVDLEYGATSWDTATEKAMDEFRGYGIGQFIHWGLYAIPGNEWEGQSARKGAAASEWIRTWSGSTAPDNWKDIYDNLYKEFNPKDFDAKQWAKQAKEMGAKYMIFTTKHHDGFALWPTKYSDYNISNTPYKKDIVKEVVDAYTDEGIDVFLYFSVLEWDNPDYLYSAPETDEEKEKYDRFLEYTRNQLLELLDNYPEITGLWFDGTWDQAWVSNYEFTYELDKEMREKHPGLIIGSRFRADEKGNRHFDENGDLIGDYEQIWERKFPEKYEDLNGNDFDVIMTIPPNGWGYMKDWEGLYTKTSDDLLDMMMKSNALSGNFVLNVGPDGDGNFKDEENELMADMGDWVAKNGEAVYDTEHADIAKTDYGYFTQKGGNLYLTVFNQPINNILRIAIDKKASEFPVTAKLLAKDQELDIKHSKIGLDLDDQTYFDIQLPESFNPDEPFVVKMKLKEGDIEDSNLMDAKK